MNPHSTVCESKLLAQSGSHICSLSDSNEIRNHNHLVCKRTFNHLAKLASLGKQLSVGLGNGLVVVGSSLIAATRESLPDLLVNLIGTHLIQLLEAE